MFQPRFCSLPWGKPGLNRKPADAAALQDSVEHRARNEGGREDVKKPPRPNVKVVSRYADSNVLMSGWGKGVNRIQNAGAVMDVGHGNGRVILFGFRPQFRAQPRGTYKLIFNSIYLGASKEANGTNKTE